MFRPLHNDGQKNIFIGSLYFYATVNLNIGVNQKFLVVEHTQQESDAAHSAIRRKTN